MDEAVSTVILYHCLDNDIDSPHHAEYYTKKTLHQTLLGCYDIRGALFVCLWDRREQRMTRVTRWRQLCKNGTAACYTDLQFFIKHCRH